MKKIHKLIAALREILPYRDDGASPCAGHDPTPACWRWPIFAALHGRGIATPAVVKIIAVLVVYALFAAELCRRPNLDRVRGEPRSARAAHGRGVP